MSHAPSRWLVGLGIILAWVSWLSYVSPAGAGEDNPPQSPDPFGAEPSATRPASEDPFGAAAKPAVDPNNPFGDAVQPAAREKNDKVDAASPPAKKPTASKGLRHGEQVLRKALAASTDAEFVETPLADVVNYLAESHNLLITLNRRALVEVGVETDAPVSLNVTGVPLRTVLEMVTEQLDLTWDIRHDVLEITTPEAAAMNLVTRVYHVGDLIYPPDDHPYQSERLPTISEPRSSWSRPLMQGAGGGAAPAGGSIGGGFFNVQMGGLDGAEQSAAGGGMGGPGLGCYGVVSSESVADFDSLIDVITSTVAPVSWDQVGGPGSIAPHGQSLVVSQTFRVHEKIERLLQALRRQRQAVPTVAIEARWLLLSAEQAKTLAEEKGIDPAALEKLAGTVQHLRGRIVCQSGQRVHLVSGDRRAVVTGAIPVVGSGAAYQPVSVIPNIGALLEIQPTMLDGGQHVMLDLKSVLTSWNEPEPPLAVGGQTAIDRPNLRTEQLETSARVPLGRPVLIGGLASPTEVDDNGQPPLIYLVLWLDLLR